MLHLASAVEPHSLLPQSSQSIVPSLSSSSNSMPGQNNSKFTPIYTAMATLKEDRPLPLFQGSLEK